MKKLFATFLALALAASMSMTAFAGEATLTDTNLSQDIDVTAKYNAADAEEPAVRSVDITWTDPTFTYTVGGGTKTWNPDDHTYLTSNASVGTWDKTSIDFTVTNHSNVDVTAKFSFAAEDGFVGKFSKDNSMSDTYKMNLDAGVENKKDEADSDTVTFKLINWPTMTQDTKIGTITIILS